MALVFAVFLVTLLVVLLRPEGRARRIAQLSAFAAQAARIARAILHRGTEAVDRIAAHLAEDHRSTGGVSKLLTPQETGSADQAEPSASS